MLRGAASESPTDHWILYRFAWVCNRMERPGEALEPAFTAWNLEPCNQWYLAEYLKALRNLEEYDRMMDCAGYVRGGGVCRYYLAVAERELGTAGSFSIDYLAGGCMSMDDSVSADACAWMAILLQGTVEPDSILFLLDRAVRLRPGDDFYRCLLAEELASQGFVEDAREQVHFLRLSGDQDYSYWQAVAALARAEEDEDRWIWALRRAMALRTCPESGRNLGWALYIAGRDALRNGDAVSSRVRLLEASALGDSSEIFVQRSDSLLGLIYEFEESGTADR